MEVVPEPLPPVTQEPARRLRHVLLLLVHETAKLGLGLIGVLAISPATILKILARIVLAATPVRVL
jgi:hypothetical protein